MNVNFTSKKVSPNFKIFFINKDKKNLNQLSISPNKDVERNVLNSLSKMKLILFSQKNSIDYATVEIKSVILIVFCL